jgi:type VI secretion system secreted protein Hcp
VTQGASAATGGGGGAGKVKIHDISFTKKIDSASPLLFLNCANGSHIKEANFVVRKAGGTQLEYLKYKLSDVLISGISPHGSADSNLGSKAAGGGGGPVTGGDEIPMEEVSLAFGKIEITYQAQGADGKAQGGPILAGWDVKGNQKV